MADNPDNKPVTFLASFPATQGAIKITGDGGGMRIELDIPESEMGEAIRIMLYRMCRLRVTIEPYEQKGYIPGQTNLTTVKRVKASGRKR